MALTDIVAIDGETQGIINEINSGVSTGVLSDVVVKTQDIVALLINEIGPSAIILQVVRRIR
jgi:hypothetical protein